MVLCTTDATRVLHNSPCPHHVVTCTGLILRGTLKSWSQDEARKSICVNICICYVPYYKFAWILHTGNTDCQSLIRNNSTSKSFDELEVTVQCERGSGKFSAICTQYNTTDCTPLPFNCNNSSGRCHADPGNNIVRQTKIKIQSQAI